MKELKDDIKSIYTRSTWLLGILIVVILALASFLFLPPEIQIQKYTAAKIGITYLFAYYLAIVSVYMRIMIIPNFKKPDYKLNEKELKEKLDRLSRNLNALATLFVLPLPIVAISAFWLFY